MGWPYVQDTGGPGHGQELTVGGALDEAVLVLDAHDRGPVLQAREGYRPGCSRELEGIPSYGGPFLSPNAFVVAVDDCRRRCCLGLYWWKSLMCTTATGNGACCEESICDCRQGR